MNIVHTCTHYIYMYKNVQIHEKVRLINEFLTQNNQGLKEIQIGLSHSHYSREYLHI